MQIEKHNGHGDFASVIKSGLVILGRENVAEGATIFLPGPYWTPEDGHAGLVAVKVEQIHDDVVVGRDDDGQIWALWLS